MDKTEKLIYQKCIDLNDRYNEINEILLSQHDNSSSEFQLDIQKQSIKLKKELSMLEDIIDLIKDYIKTCNDISEYDEILSNQDVYDSEIIQIAKDEIHELKNTLSQMTPSIKKALLPIDEVDSSNVILEVRAGTGGDEASLFASEMFRMYLKYCDIKGFRVELLNKSENGTGGLKEVSAIISGKNVYGAMKYESGIHRVQRIPETEANGRIHTSAITVAILPEASDIDIKINEKDLRIDIYRSSGCGGQSVNTTDSAVRITHIPTGIVVTQQDERSQRQNKEKAMKILRSKLYELEREKQDLESSMNRKIQVGSGDRSEKIRTYNFPQDRITDHRISYTIYNLKSFLNGELLDNLSDALKIADVQKYFENND